jgi:hypothetical protein
MVPLRIWLPAGRGSPVSIYRERSSSSVGHRQKTRSFLRASQDGRAAGLKFGDGSLDFVFGVAILRHLDFARSARDPPRIAEGGKDRLCGIAATTRRLVWFAG